MMLRDVVEPLHQPQIIKTIYEYIQVMYFWFENILSLLCICNVIGYLVFEISRYGSTKRHFSKNISFDEAIKKSDLIATFLHEYNKDLCYFHNFKMF